MNKTVRQLENESWVIVYMGFGNIALYETWDSDLTSSLDKAAKFDDLGRAKARTVREGAKVYKLTMRTSYTLEPA